MELTRSNRSPRFECAPLLSQSKPARLFADGV